MAVWQYYIPPLQYVKSLWYCFWYSTISNKRCFFLKWPLLQGKTGSFTTHLFLMEKSAFRFSLLHDTNSTILFLLLLFMLNTNFRNNDPRSVDRAKILWQKYWWGVPFFSYTTLLTVLRHLVYTVKTLFSRKLTSALAPGRAPSHQSLQKRTHHTWPNFHGFMWNQIRAILNFEFFTLKNCGMQNMEEMMQKRKTPIPSECVNAVV